MKYLAAILAVLSLVSCAANAPIAKSKFARLMDAQPNFTLVDNVRYRGYKILLLPGKHLIRKNCATPPSPDNTMASVYSTPPIEYVFEANVVYILDCKGNSIDIGPLVF